MTFSVGHAMHFRTVAIFGKYQEPGIAEPLQHLARFITQRGHTVLLDAQTAQHLTIDSTEIATATDIGQRADVAVILGGDGTMLGIARQLAPFNVPVVGINHGRLGFITDISLANYEAALSAVLDGSYLAEERMMLEARVTRGETLLFEASALNDVVINRAGRSGMIEFTVTVNDQLMSRQRADGLIIATPTGSTAYALSVGGPVLHPGLRGMVLVPVAPQSLSNRPIVIPDDYDVDITLARSPGGRDHPANVHCDMQTWSSLIEGDRIAVRRSTHGVRFLHPQGYRYFSSLQLKLNWNRMPSDSLNTDSASSVEDGSLFTLE